MARHCCLLGFYVEGTEEREQVTWCGRTDITMEWLFQDPSHTLLNILRGGLPTLCRDCEEAMIETLRGRTTFDFKERKLV